VTVRPGAPHELNSIAGISVGVETSCSRALVAVYVCGPGGSGFHETDVLVEGIPACGLGTAVLCVVVPHGV
jgi:hypothetical protein